MPWRRVSVMSLRYEFVSLAWGPKSRPVSFSTRFEGHPILVWEWDRVVSRFMRSLLTAEQAEKVSPRVRG